MTGTGTGFDGQPQVGFNALPSTIEQQFKQLFNLGDPTLIQANAATNLEGFTVRQDFSEEIETFIRKETIFWRLIKNKVPAAAEIVRYIRESQLPNVGFVQKTDLSNATEPGPGGFNNQLSDIANDLSDPGQVIKALSGSIDYGHFPRSLADQQNRPYGDMIAKSTNDLIAATCRILEKALIAGNDQVNPLSINGLNRLMFNSNSNVHTMDITGAEPDSIVQKINEITTRISTDENILNRVTCLLTSGATSVQVSRELGNSIFWANQTMVVPGVTVPAIQTNYGALPLVVSPYLRDTPGETNNDPDILHLYLIDVDTLEWHGVFPFGGIKDNYNPQIFDISKYIGAKPLVERRMVLQYGTLYARNKGRGIHRLDITAPRGSAFLSQ